MDDLNLTLRTADPVAAAVPEPGAWALMILGFGAAGAALRRRRGLALSASL
ncbi:PEPxxWA-CTERM sorting domain-containing protein [Phenylobacterium sp. SCN 70-31]|uniref:PEPxxWA-CTERM sorting domain-containing protein n=1 Tax=Phenylobacterium sp. SCN 70-31 TaxID=1660129 RepID=UPI0025F89F06|nr:PEPxxWA-CTERM sorting domain-containing protein [Phenylobacterium sp. SCN 70-31]